MQHTLFIMIAAIAPLLSPVVQAQSVSCGAGGGFRLAPNAEAIYSYSVDAETVTVAMLVVARAQKNWRGFQGSRTKIHTPAYMEADRTRYGGGATIDTTWILYDRQAHAVRLGSQSIPLPARDNVLLVDRIDGAGGAPIAVGTTYLTPFVTKGRCGETAHTTQELRRRLDALALVRAFLGDAP